MSLGEEQVMPAERAHSRNVGHGEKACPYNQKWDLRARL